MKEADVGIRNLELIQAQTLPEVREQFVANFVHPRFDDNIRGLMNFNALAKRLSGRVIRSFLNEIVAETEEKFRTTKGKRLEVKVYMIDERTRDLFEKVGRILADLSRVKDTVILPESEEELTCLIVMLGRALKTGEPITFFTPVCPDWSRDGQGRYDFQSLGGGESFIANKFFVNAPQILEVFDRQSVPFRGVILFADWGLETEIDAKNTYGQKLSPEDIKMSFASTFAATDQALRVLQDDRRLGPLFAGYEVVSMAKFLAKRINEKQVMADMHRFFTTDISGLKLLGMLNRDSLEVNKQRLGVTDKENRQLAIRNLVEYSTIGQAIGDQSILLVCESRTTSRCYNLPREKAKKVPVFYIKGKEALGSGVNVL